MQKRPGLGSTPPQTPVAVCAYFDERRCSAVYVGIDAVRSVDRADRYDTTFCEVTVIACPTLAPAKSSE